jgi:hypothetical protein
MKKYIKKMTGYKATNADLTCNGYQFKLGKWHEHEGDVELCKGGFHFCVHPSGPWSYYPDRDTRVFRVEAEHVLDVPVEPGADFKLVAKRIRLVEEITPPKENGSNTGYGNTGDRNTGRRNTGHWNTGHWNTGDRNTGDRNTGYRNTGYGNTGDGNTGNRNTGYGNTGYGNTGDGNTGYGNTGDGNATNFSAGFFCTIEPTVVCFDVQTNLTRDQFADQFPEYQELCELLHKPEPIPFEQFKRLPGITKAKLSKLHKKHLAAKSTL